MAHHSPLHRPPSAIAAVAALVAALLVALLVALVLGACSAATGARQSPSPVASAADAVVATPSPSPSPARVVVRVPAARSPRPTHPGPTPTPAPTAAPTPALEPAPGPGPFAIDLYRDGDFVSQARADWCVPASILTMVNLADGEAVRAGRPATQATLDRLARSLSTDRLVGAGSEPEGWAGALNELGLGQYAVIAEATREEAIAAAARALRLTGRPVGLLMWRGAHAWVMSGFEATADPAWTDEFRVTHVRVVDSWHPRRSSIWGPAQVPDARIAVSSLAEDYLPWRRPTVRYPEKDGRFVLVVPVAASEELASH